jgi:hypothetical protein
MGHPHPSFEAASFAGNPQLHAEAAVSPGIPATPDVDVDAGAPCPETETAVARLRLAAPFNDISSLLHTSLPQPQSPPLPCAQTPLQEERPRVDFDFASALPPTNLSLPTPTVLETAHSLRLPSFNFLGIDAPHPDRLPSTPSHSLLFAAFGAGPLSKPEDPLHALSPPLHHLCLADAATESQHGTPAATRAKLERIIPTYTPPFELGTFNWGSLVNVRTAGVGSPPSSEPASSPSLAVTASATAPGQAPIIVPMHADFGDAMRRTMWVEEAEDTISAFI